MHTPMFSLEVFPPKRDAPVGTIYDTLDGLEGLNPDFISVTYGHGTHSDRTATARIANTIHGEYGIPAVAHLTALYSDEAKIDEALDMFEAAGVSAVLALRGDYIDGEEPVTVTRHGRRVGVFIPTRGDRAEAIRGAVGMLQSGDTLIVAGKGHEEGQTVGTVTLPFSDHAELRKALEELDR